MRKRIQSTDLAVAIAYANNPAMAAQYVKINNWTYLSVNNSLFGKGFACVSCVTITLEAEMSFLSSKETPYLLRAKYQVFCAYLLSMAINLFIHQLWRSCVMIDIAMLEERNKIRKTCLGDPGETITFYYREILYSAKVEIVQTFCDLYCIGLSVLDWTDRKNYFSEKIASGEIREIK